jgi:hypothetical protein
VLCQAHQTAEPPSDKRGGPSDDEIPAAASACGHQHQHESIKEAATSAIKRDAQAMQMSM